MNFNGLHKKLSVYCSFLSRVKDKLLTFNFLCLQKVNYSQKINEEAFVKFSKKYGKKMRENKDFSEYLISKCSLKFNRKNFMEIEGNYVRSEWTDCEQSYLDYTHLLSACFEKTIIYNLSKMIQND